MAKKKFYVGMLAAALAFALVLSGCDSDGNGTTDPGPPPGPGEPPPGQTLFWQFPNQTATDGSAAGFQQSGSPGIDPPFSAPGLPIVVTGRAAGNWNAIDMLIPLVVGDTVRIIAGSDLVTMAQRESPWSDYGTAAPYEGRPGYYLIEHTVVEANIQADGPGFRIRTGQTTEDFTIYGIYLYR